MKLDCRSLGNWGQISRTFYQSLVLTGEMTEMLRIKLYQITRLDLTHYTKEELGFLSQVNEKKPKISIGRDHTLILDDEGRVSSFGSNEFGQLGTSKVLGYQAIPILIEISDIIEVSAGAYHSILLNSQGQVYSFGSNNFGQLGLRYEGGNVSTPTLISTITSSPTTKIIAISAGSYYSLFLNSQGQVFSCGANEFGQLGLGDNDERYEPTLIEISNIVAISAGESDSLALNSQGQAYYFGSTFYPRGIKEVNDRRTPRLINLSNIVAISIERHSLLLDSQGQVYNFGENASGRYDVETRNGGEFTVVPVTKPDLGKIRTIAAGGTNSLLCNTRDQIFSTGYYDNQLVLIDTSVIDKIDPLGSARVAAISAGDSNFLISNLQGQVFDLEFGDDNDHPIPTLVENLAV
jgi:alpha-tubulin suppressor-like RCC1 family protein